MDYLIFDVGVDLLSVENGVLIQSGPGRSIGDLVISMSG